MNVMESIPIKREYNSDEEYMYKGSVSNITYYNNNIESGVGKDIKLDIDIEEHVLDNPDYINIKNHEQFLCNEISNIKKESGTDSGKYQCNLCPFQSKFSGNLSRHFKSVHKQEHFHCHYCDFVTSRKENLKKHLGKIHKSVKPSSNGYSGVRKISKIPDNEDPTSVINLKKVFTVEETKPFTPKVYTCNICQFKTIKNSNIYAHIKTKHIDPSALKFFKCSFCDYKSIRNTTLKKHIRNKHTNKSILKYYRCEICEFQTYHRYSLTQHKKKEHTELVKCTICGCKFIGKYDLNLHMQEQHFGNLQLYECANCDFRCYRKKIISKHIMTYHTSQ